MRTGPIVNVANVRYYLKDVGAYDYERNDNAGILNAILSRELPPERFNGVLSLILAFRNGASDEEIEKTAVNLLFA